MPRHLSRRRATRCKHARGLLYSLHPRLSSPPSLGKTAVPRGTTRQPGPGGNAARPSHPYLPPPRRRRLPAVLAAPRRRRSRDGPARGPRSRRPPPGRGGTGGPAARTAPARPRGAPLPGSTAPAAASAQALATASTAAGEAQPSSVWRGVTPGAVGRPWVTGTTFPGLRKAAAAAEACEGTSSAGVRSKPNRLGQAQGMWAQAAACSGQRSKPSCPGPRHVCAGSCQPSAGQRAAAEASCVPRRQGPPSPLTGQGQQAEGGRGGEAKGLVAGMVGANGDFGRVAI